MSIVKNFPIPIRETPYLKLKFYTISDFIIPACSGGPRASLVYPGKAFKKHAIPPDFKNWKLNNKQPATEATPIVVYSMGEKDGTFEEVVTSFNVDKKN